MLSLSGAVVTCFFTAATVQAASNSGSSVVSDATQRLGSESTEFEFTVDCDPLYAEGTGSGYHASKRRNTRTSASRLANEGRLGLRPPKCSIEGNQDGGTFSCECADGSKTDGTVSVADAKAMHDNFIDSFEWCEDKVQQVCGKLTQPMESVCENDYGVCAITAYSRTPDLAFSDLEQTCECNDERTWLASTPTISSFKLDQKTLDNTCLAEVARCAPEKSDEQATSAIELPKETLSYPMALGCMDTYGMCRVYSDESEHWTHCECFAQEGGASGVEAPWPLASIPDMLVLCKEELAMCPPEEIPEPEDEPKDENGDTQPGCPDQGELPKGENDDAQPGCPELPKGGKLSPSPRSFRWIVR